MDETFTLKLPPSMESTAILEYAESYEYCYDRENKNLLVRYSEDGTFEKYVYGNGLIASSETRESQSPKYRTYLYDLRGSVTFTLDSSANITSEYQYSTYGTRGVVKGNTTSELGYCAREGVLTEVTGLLYMRARYYMPDFMRFINQDIVTGDISNSNSLNRYTYVEGNPATMIDPFGLCAEKTSTKAYNKLCLNPNVDLVRIAIHFYVMTGKLTKYNAEEEIARHLDAETLRKIAKAYDKVSDFFDGAGSSLKKKAESARDRALSPSPYMSLAPLGGMGSSFSYSYGQVAVYQGISIDTALVVIVDIGLKAGQLIVADATEGAATLLSYVGDSAGETADHYNNKADNKFHKTEHPLDDESPYKTRVGIQKGETPRSNQAQNKEFNILVKKYGLNKKQQRMLHDEITKEGYGKSEIEAIIIELFGGD